MKRILSIASLVITLVLLLYRIGRIKKRNEMESTLETAMSYQRQPPDTTTIRYTDIYGFPERIKLMYQNQKKKACLIRLI